MNYCNKLHAKKKNHWLKKMKIAKGKITIKKSGNGGYKSIWIYVPSKIYKDDSFPFNQDEEVLIEIEDGSLIVSKSDERSKILKNFGVENANLPKLLEIKASVNKDLPFLYFEDQVFSFLDMNQKSNQIAHGIISIVNELGLKTPKIAVLMNNSPEYLFSWFGLAKAGCIFVPIEKKLNSKLVEHVLNNSDSEILILDYEFLRNFELVHQNLPRIKKVFIRNAPKEFNYNDIYKPYKSLITPNLENPLVNIFNQDPVGIQYTEGTTGKPKGVVYRNIVLAGINIGYEFRELGLKKGSKIYCTGPLSHASTHYYTILPSLFYNNSVIITEKFDPVTFWEDIENHKPTHFSYFGGYLTELLFQKPKNHIHMIDFAYGFGAKTDTWNAFEKRFGVQLIEIWSLVEGVGIAMNKVGSKGGKLGSIGKPLDTIEMKIVDQEKNELSAGPDNAGEIAVRRKSLTLFEYYKEPQNRDVRIGENKWVYTGDYGYRDFDGFFYFKGKKDDFILTGGQHIFARDIEAVANAHPHIVETAVIPVTNGTSSKKELKITVVKDKNKKITPQEVSDFLYHNLAYFHVPRFIEFKDTIPKGPSTEILKSVLRKEWEEESSRNKIWDTQIKDFLK
jgi:crotonobetaine/carnitine-CoA ligase